MTLEYNGYQFSDKSHVKVKVDFVFDDADRTVKYHKYHISVDSIIVREGADNDVSDHMLRVRQRLSKTGAVLRLSDAGLNLEVNYYNVKDVNFGPKPRVLEWNPIGNTNAAEIRWECETCVPVCDGTGLGPRYNGLASLNYEINYSINSKGFTTRTVNGSLTVAMTRDGRSIPDTADRYRELIVIRKPNEYIRETQDWRISSDKTRAEFTFIDRQIESRNAYPPGVVAIRGNHRVGWTRRNRAYLPNSIDVEIELAHDQPTVRAWEIFIGIVRQRLQAGINSYKPIFLETLDVDEDLFGTTMRFNVGYRVASEVGELFNVTGLFQPLDYQWEYWARSIANITGARGISQMRHLPTEDRITDLCDTGTPTTTQPTSAGLYPPIGNFPRICNQKPEPRLSWLRFEAALSEETEWGTVYQTTLGGVEIKDRPFNPSDPDPLLNEIDSPDVETLIAERSPEMRWRWTGLAERIGYPVDIPDRLKIGDVELRRSGRRMVTRRHLGTHFCVPLYGAAWDIEYRVVKRPKKADTENLDPAASTT